MGENVRARLRLRSLRVGGGASEVTLQDDGNVVFDLAPAELGRWTRVAERVDAGAKLWGATTFWSGAALGVYFRWKGKRVAGYTFLALAGAMALFTSEVRCRARKMTHDLTAPTPADRVAMILSVGLLTFKRTDLPGVALIFGPGDFDPDEAEAFRTALEAAHKDTVDFSPRQNYDFTIGRP